MCLQQPQLALVNGPRVENDMPRRLLRAEILAQLGRFRDARTGLRPEVVLSPEVVERLTEGGRCDLLSGLQDLLRDEMVRLPEGKFRIRGRAVAEAWAASQERDVAGNPIRPQQPANWRKLCTTLVRLVAGEEHSARRLARELKLAGWDCKNFEFLSSKGCKTRIKTLPNLVDFVNDAVAGRAPAKRNKESRAEAEDTQLFVLVAAQNDTLVQFGPSFQDLASNTGLAFTVVDLAERMGESQERAPFGQSARWADIFDGDDDVDDVDVDNAGGDPWRSFSAAGTPL